MSIFKEKFTSLLNEAPGDDEVSDADAMAATLDQGTDPGDFDVEAPNMPEVRPEDAIKQQNAHMISRLQEWITEMEQFSDYLNGLDEGSIQSQLNNASCDT